jgi:hypothetical protein
MVNQLGNQRDKLVGTELSFSRNQTFLNENLVTDYPCS